MTKNRNRKGLIAGIVLALLLAVTGVSAQDQDSTRSYSVHGKIIAARLVSVHFVGDSFWDRWVYRVDCGDLYYDLQGDTKPSFTIGQGISFRIEKETAYMKGDKKELQYPLVGMGLPDQKQKSD